MMIIMMMLMMMAGYFSYLSLFSIQMHVKKYGCKNGAILAFRMLINYTFGCLSGG